MKVTRARVLAAARARWGQDVEAFGFLDTIGPASGPYARDGRKEFHAMVRRTDWSPGDPWLVNVTAPTAAEAWAIALVRASP